MRGEIEVILTVDIGNSMSVFGFMETVTGRLMARWQCATDPSRLADEWQALLAPVLTNAHLTTADVDGIVISSVVPAVTTSLRDTLSAWLGHEPMIVSARLNLGIDIRVDAPLLVGADRLADAIAAYELQGGPVIVIDAGTATKIDAVAADGAFLGGAIAPGVGIGLEALARRAAQLSTVELRPPPHVIGRNTTEAVQSGVVLGHVAMIEGMVRRAQAVLGDETPVVLTGGFGHLLGPLSPVFRVFEPDLVLAGLRYVWLRNR